MSRPRARKLPDARHEVLAAGWVISEPLRCVQCDICSFNCPIDIDVRRHA
jgi:L-lactate utilization protein LutB